MNDFLPFPEFTEPWLVSADVVLDQSGGANDEGQIDPTDLINSDFDVVVDKAIIFENSLRDPPANPGADWQLLAAITGRWWFRLNQTDSLPEMPIAAWDNSRMDRTLPVVHGVQEPQDFAALGMDLRRTPIIVPRSGILACQWENPTIVAALAVPAGIVHLAAFCRGRQTRRVTTLYLPVSFLASAGGGVAGPTGRTTYQDSSKNRLDEELELLDLRFWLDGDYGKNVAWADTRIFRHLLLRPVIDPGTICLSAASNYIPLVGYGSSRQVDHAVVTMDWSDEPKLMPKNDGIGFKFENGSATKTRVTVVLVGRRKPTR